MDPIRASIRDNIKVFREKQDLTQDQLSRLCNFSPSYIGKVERGSADPSLEMLIRVADALGLSPLKLIDRSYDEHVAPDPSEGDLITSNPMFNFAFQNVDHLVGIADQEGRLLLVNKNFEQCYDLNLDDLFGTPLWETSIWNFSARGEETAGTRDHGNHPAGNLPSVSYP